ncbi:MAG: zinc ribbon domain-containing protein [Paraglaciecola sp.]|uniref:zinc ribbon domain-containing protein n=1 Tax=Paraglaciecola sp. TaxID=1920173 RepID=UPI0032640E25
MPAWGIPPKQGHHEALINKQTFKSIQERLAGNSYAPTRKDLSSDFPLRGAVCCADCETPFTSAWSKGRNKRSPYYLCYTKSCDSYGKSIKRADLEGAFEELLEQLQPMNEMFSVASKMFKTLWQTYGLNLQENKKQLLTDIQNLKHQKDKVIDAANHPSYKHVNSAFKKLNLKLLHWRKK